MKPQINRLGFEAWADNLIVDFLENHQGQKGHIVTEKPDGTVIRAFIADDKTDVLVRCYTGDCWEIHERTITNAKIQS